MFVVAEKTARKWARRYRDEGAAGMNDRSAPTTSQPARTAAPVVRRIVILRRLGPVQIGGRPGIAAPTVHAVPARRRINRWTPH